MNDRLTRRQALGALALPFITSCLDRVAGPAFDLSQFDGHITLIGAGDPHCAKGLIHRAKTAALVRSVLDQDPDARAFCVGDLTHSGTELEFRDYYEPTWGAFKDRTLFCMGNHETRYADPPGAAYYAYTGAPKYYAQTLGTWRVYSLNCEAEDQGGVRSLEQLTWLKADLAEHGSGHHILALSHYPLFNNVCELHLKSMAYPFRVRPLWRALEEYGAEVMVSGHAHRYERFSRKLNDGTVSELGIRQFVIGTGGVLTRGIILPQHPDCESWVKAHGVVRFDLYPDRYEWVFKDLTGVVRDSGSQACHKVLAV